ncbi:hypothetical protein IWW55_000012 [Coemansia sp. RSA 2706]|nr:hypothetical protein LPJ63_001594 [Coemansia sp. RSA 2711]KAJ1850060.1 hypothetical protein LPJ70_000060 [Coemansia sp. RSA 2708]KAJ2309041.1 hypothetical protein IWW55_000012 [Coemansia sp. RSA 2706]KAJ2315770.1 hypothetical protein IWW54_000011 [Coemansia sp. RSA 2705]KAJ2322477.1 hypothetical protein IWW52_000012 [Coemansia sp. RSA 2704]KAJ2330257.1 hypothetical protein IWW51_000012 [Coemansia sp. RSA 2702]KAJ2370592.1 hypothetical protein H4S01_000256 [Coemansia sp. RSA 2610]KAJ237747
MSTFDAIPVLDLALLETDKPRLLRDLQHALIHVGFFYVTGHRVPPAFLDNLARLTKGFFDLPLDLKLETDKIHSPTFLGYSVQGNEITKDKRDNREQFDFANELPDTWESSQPLYERLSGPNLWPAEDKLPGFRHAVLEYVDRARELAELLTRLVAESLGLPPNTLLENYVVPGQQHRGKLIKYPAVDQLRPIDGDQGVGPHRDTASLLTILYQATAHPGLQVQNQQGQWIDAPPIPHTFVVNIGTGLEYLVRGAATATTHRVINPPAGTGPRYSIPFFLGARLDRALVPVDIPQDILLAKDTCVVTDSGHQFSDLYKVSPGRYYLLNRISSHRDVGLKYYPELAAEHGITAGENSGY